MGRAKKNKPKKVKKQMPYAKTFSGWLDPAVFKKSVEHEGVDYGEALDRFDQEIDKILQRRTNGTIR